MSLNNQTESRSDSSLSIASKAPGAFRTIGEVSGELSVPQHVLRFWEGKFSQVRPMKRSGGRRYYRPEDVELLADIRDMLYSSGFTIRGVQKILREKHDTPTSVTKPATTADIDAGLFPTDNDNSALATATLDAVSPAPSVSSASTRDLGQILGELKAMRELLRGAGI